MSDPSLYQLSVARPLLISRDSPPGRQGDSGPGELAPIGSRTAGQMRAHPSASLASWQGDIPTTANGTSIFQQLLCAITDIDGSSTGSLALVLREPFGTVFSVAPFNFGLTLALRAIVYPLSCGNSVLLKGVSPPPRKPSSRYV